MTDARAITPTACASVPSSEHALLLLTSPSPRTALTVLGDFVLRGALVGAGAFLAGERNLAHVAKLGLCGSLVIETFVLTWVSMHAKKNEMPKKEGKDA